MSSTTPEYRHVAVRLRSGALVDVAIVAAVLAGSLVLLAHGGVDALGSGTRTAHSGSGSLDLIGIVLAVSSTVPLLAWRCFPLGVFAMIAAASVLLAGLGYPLDLMLGSAVALYLLAASRERHTPWTRRATATVFGMLVAYLGASAAAQGTFPGIGEFHTPAAWAVAWFAGERTRLRREHVADLKERALRAEREAERERLLAAAEE
ncbi:MAG: hypothetical protein ACRDOO_21665, partial [Actinomadura sp.]